MSHWVRGTLLGIVVGLVAVFGIALWLDPYDRATTRLRPEFVGALAAAPDAEFLGQVPWAAFALSNEDEPVTPVARRMETHRQLGLPPCTFKELTKLPCPSCGMTTSFALLIRGDVGNSLRANAVGTLLAAFCLTMIPWGLATVVRGRPLFIRSMERTLTLVVVALLTLMLLRWGIVLGLHWLGVNAY